MDDSFNEMPQSICGCCIRKLKAAYSFVRQAQEVNDKLWSMIKGGDDVDSMDDEDDEDDKPLNCLQEAQIDIQDCLEIKMEDDDETAGDNKNNVSKLEVELKQEEPDEGSGEMAKSTTSKKESKEV